MAAAQYMIKCCGREGVRDKQQYGTTYWLLVLSFSRFSARSFPSISLIASSFLRSSFNSSTLKVVLLLPLQILFFFVFIFRRRRKTFVFLLPHPLNPREIPRAVLLPPFPDLWWRGQFLERWPITTAFSRYWKKVKRSIFIIIIFVFPHSFIRAFFC